MQIQADFYQGPNRQGVRGLDQGAIQTDIDGFAQELCLGGFEPHLDLCGHPTEAPPLPFDSSLNRAKQVHHAHTVNWFVNEEGSAGPEATGKGTRALVGTDKDDWRHLIESRVAKFSNEFKVGRRRCAHSNNDQIKLLIVDMQFVADASCWSYDFYAHRYQDILEECTHLWVGFDDERTPDRWFRDSEAIQVPPAQFKIAFNVHEPVFPRIIGSATTLSPIAKVSVLQTS